MKSLFALALTASLALNAIVLATALRARSSPASPAAPPAVSPIPATLAAPVVDAHTWAGLSSPDLPQLVARLRTAGFPPDLLRAIVAAQISKSFAARRQALAPNSADLAYWKNSATDPATALQLRQLDREEQKQLRDLLGPDAESDDALARLNQTNVAFLPAEKARDVLAVVRDYADRRAELNATGVTFQTDREKLNALDKEQHDRIAQLLTPAELLEYDLRTSNTARNLRANLDVFQPTEEEFRMIYQLRAPVDERFRSEMVITTTSPAGVAQKLLAEQIKAALGPQRAADYERATDFNYRRTSQLVTRLELPPTTTDQLWTVQKEFEQRRATLSALPPEQRNSQLTALRQEATARLTPLLGNARNVEAYQQYGGQWLQNLVPRPVPARPGVGN